MFDNCRCFFGQFSCRLSTLRLLRFTKSPEIGDFGILIYGGVKKIKALFLNFFSSLTTILGGICGILFFEKMGGQVLFLLPFAAGGFIYVAATDLIPQIKQEESNKKSIGQFLVFLTGVLFMALMKLLTR